MNIQHSSRTDEWYTPLYVIDKVLEVIAPIDLDPASSEQANERIGASRIYTRLDDGLTQDWSASSVFVNPPGGKTGNKSNTALFWQKLMDSVFDEAVFLAFSLEALQTTQKCSRSMLEFPLCVPRKRIRFERPDGTLGKAPSHSNVIVYVPGAVNNTDRFIETFSQLGQCK